LFLPKGASGCNNIDKRFKQDQSPAQIGKRRNEPQFVSYVAETIAQLKRIPFDEVAQITTENVKNLYQIK